jgi:hypothetical protein
LPASPTGRDQSAAQYAAIRRPISGQFGALWAPTYVADAKPHAEDFEKSTRTTCPMPGSSAFLYMEANGLANDLQGDPFDVPEQAVAWRVKKVTGKQGPPAVVYRRRGGGPLTIPIDAELATLEAEIEIEGKYRLDPVDASGHVCGETAAYAYARPASSGDARRNALAPTDNIAIEALRANTELARAVIERVPVLLDTATALMRVRLTAPCVTHTDDDDGEAIADAPEAVGDPAAPPRGFDWMALLELLRPLVLAGASKLPGGAAALADWRRALPPATPPPSTASPTNPAPATEAPSATATEAPTAEDLVRFLRLQAQLTPEEAQVTRALAAELSPAERAAWVRALSSLSDDDALARVRATLAALQASAATTASTTTTATTVIATKDGQS